MDAGEGMGNNMQLQHIDSGSGSNDAEQEMIMIIARPKHMKSARDRSPDQDLPVLALQASHHYSISWHMYGLWFEGVIKHYIESMAAEYIP